MIDMKQLYIAGLLFLSAIALPAYGTRLPLPESCQTQCVTPYGDVLGKTKNNITAYSNCQSTCVVFNPEKHNGTYTGIQWQCVEYARRWLLINHGVVYGDVDYAVDIWDKIDSYRRVSDGRQLATRNIVNGSALPPQAGDLLVYARAMFGGTGHVAVVISVDRKRRTIRLAEQNYSNKKWPADYSREVPYVIRQGNYWVLDGYLLGWKRMKPALD